MNHILNKLAVTVAFLLVIVIAPASAYAVTLTPNAGATDGAQTGAVPAPSTASAGKTDACDALKQLDSTKSCSSGDTSISHLIGSVINILSAVVGIAAVIVVIVSGLKYVTSGGDSAGISSAKNSLVYALVGLAVAALAQVLVHFVLYSVGPQACLSDPKQDASSATCLPPKKK